MFAVLFLIYWQLLLVEQIRVKVIAFVYLEYTQNSSRQYSVDRLTQNYIPCLGQRGQKPYIPCPVAHTCTRIGYIRE